MANDCPDSIRVQTALSGAEAYTTALTAATEAGYVPTWTDRERRTFDTEPRVRGDLSVSLSAAVVGDTSAAVVLWGRFALVGVCDEGPIRQVGECGCPVMQAWAELEAVAARIDGVASPARSDTLALPGR